MEPPRSDELEYYLTHYEPSECYPEGKDSGLRTLPAASKAETYVEGGSRVKPAIPILSPTNAGPHTRSSHGAGLYYNDGTYLCYKDGLRHPKQSYSVVSAIQSPFSISCPEPSWADNLRGNINDLGFDWYTECAELPQTVKMFTDIAHRVGAGYKALRRGKLSQISPNASLKSIPSTILMNNFGIAPLLNTAGQLLEAVAEPRLKLKKVATSGESFADETNSNDVRIQKSISVRAGCTVEFTRSYDPYMNTGNILSTAWELVPWSWAIDYFLPIGGYLQNRCLPEGIIVKGIWRTRTEQYLHEQLQAHEAAGRLVTPPFMYKETWQRNRYDSIPPPPLPRFKTNLSVRKLINLMSALSLKIS